MAESKVVVPESVLKKRKREEEWALEKKQNAEAAKKKNVENRKLIFKRAEQYAKEYADKVTPPPLDPNRIRVYMLVFREAKKLICCAFSLGEGVDLVET